VSSPVHSSHIHIDCNAVATKTHVIISAWGRSLQTHFEVAQVSQPAVSHASSVHALSPATGQALRFIPSFAAMDFVFHSCRFVSVLLIVLVLIILISLSKGSDVRIRPNSWNSCLSMLVLQKLTVSDQNWPKMPGVHYTNQFSYSLPRVRRSLSASLSASSRLCIESGSGKMGQNGTKSDSQKIGSLSPSHLRRLPFALSHFNSEPILQGSLSRFPTFSPATLRLPKVRPLLIFAHEFPQHECTNRERISHEQARQ